MSPDAPTLAFVLDAPLQSWGTESRFQRRGTDLHPSKSAVLGMISAAMGLDKYAENAAEELQPLAALSFGCAVLPRVLSGWRGSRASTVRQLSDYHTVGGGYDEVTERLSIPRSAERGVFGTVVTRRVYLADARFLVLLQGDSLLLEQIRDQLRNPVWGLWLGRKCCAPALPIHPELDTTRDAAVAAAISPVRAMAMWEELERWEETAATAPNTSLVNDQPHSFGLRHFQPRPVRHSHATITPPGSDAMFDAL